MSEDKALMKFSSEELQLVKDTVAKDATDAELKLFLYTAKLRGLNPLTKQIHFVKRKNKEGVSQGTIQTGIDGFRLIAQRTGKYLPGSKPTIFDYDNKGWLDRATVFGMKVFNGQGFEFSATAKFSEYAQYFNNKLGVMWEKMPETMLEKCAEAKMLRRGFPEELSGIYADEEMQQADGQPLLINEAKESRVLSPNAETQQASEISPEDFAKLSGNPFTGALENCPCGSPWNEKRDRFGKLSHATSEKNKEGKTIWHNFQQQVGIKAKDLAKDAFMNESTFKTWIAEHYGGKAWGKLTEIEMIEVLGELYTIKGNLSKSKEQG